MRSATPSSAPPLERCVGDVAAFAANWGRRPALLRGADPDGFRDVLCLADVDRIISSAARPPTVRMMRDGSPVEPREYCTSLRIGGKQLDDVIDPRKVTDTVRRGATVVLQSLHRTTPSVASFVAELQRQISHPVQANAYLTPANASGLAEHADAHDVIVLQLHGSKRWWVGGTGSTGSAPDGCPSGDSDGLGDVEISAGDSMYIPAGSRHRASTTDEPSLHLTLGIVRVTYRDVVERILADGPDLLDRPLPIGYQLGSQRDDGCRGDRTANHRFACETASMLDEVGRFLAAVDVEQCVRREVQRRRPEAFTPGHLTALLGRQNLTGDTWLRWSAPPPRGRRGTSGPWVPLDALHDSLDDFDDDTDLQDSGGPALRIHLGDRVLTVPPVVLDAIRLLSGGEPVRVDDLPRLDLESRVVLARRLIEETACVIDPGR